MLDYLKSKTFLLQPSMTFTFEMCRLEIKPCAILNLVLDASILSLLESSLTNILLIPYYYIFLKLVIQSK